MVPPSDESRAKIRDAAGQMMVSHDRLRPPNRDFLETMARDLLGRVESPETYLGFAMVALNNAFWREAFAGVPFERRLFLLPHCMRDDGKCAGIYDSLGLHCAACGSCRIHDLKQEAESLGYRVLIAEGTTAVTTEILDQERDAVLGVACLDSLEKSFARVIELGIPHLAVPLLSNGCRHTQAETDVIQVLLHEYSPAAITTQTYLPLLREARRLGSPEALRELLAPFVNETVLESRAEMDHQTVTEALAVEWLREGGKRFRPFVTLAAYAVGREGARALNGDADLARMIPVSIRRLALAIEALHKASLVHDDIEDDSPFRYGRATLHHERGIAPALNVGDYLVGLGYRLVASAREELGAERIADIIEHLAGAHLQLCRGQGAEFEIGSSSKDLAPMDVLTIHAMKTAPAFEAALYAGLRAADAVPEKSVLRRFSTLLGEGYQIINDLDDWRADGRNKIDSGQDVSLSRPTILRAFTLEAGGGWALKEAAEARDPHERVALTRAAYEKLGAFQKAHALVGKLRERALATSSEMGDGPIRELLGFLVRVILDPN